MVRVRNPKQDLHPSRVCVGGFGSWKRSAPSRRRTLRGAWWWSGSRSPCRRSGASRWIRRVRRSTSRTGWRAKSTLLIIVDLFLETSGTVVNTCQNFRNIMFRFRLYRHRFFAAEYFIPLVSILQHMLNSTKASTYISQKFIIVIRWQM